MRHCTICNIFLTLDEYTELKHFLFFIFFGHFCNFSQIELFYLCRFHSDMATCRPTLFLWTMKEILLVHFIITNFRVAHNMLCTPWLRNPLTISRLSYLGRKAALGTICLSVRQSTISHP
jgi:hypothetical protein